MTAVESTESAEYARQLTDRIKVAVEGTWQLIAEAYTKGAHLALGYGSWDDYCTREFGTSRLKLPHEERMGTVKSLRQAGLSLRAIEAATGVSKTTVIKDLRQVVQSAPPEPAVTFENVDDAVEWLQADEDGPGKGTPTTVTQFAGDLAAADAGYAERAAAVSPKITGIDGKQYKSSPAPRVAHRKPLVDSAHVAGLGLREAMEKVERLFDDDRYRQNAEQVALALRGHLSYVAETVTAVLDQLP